MFDQTRQPLQEAEDLINRGEREQARLLLESILKTTPDNADARRLLDRLNAQAVPPPSGSQIGESLDDLFGPSPQATRATPVAPPPPGYVPPAYVPLPPTAKRPTNPLLYILLGLAIAAICVCAVCVGLPALGVVGVLSNPTGQAIFNTAGAIVSTGVNMAELPDTLPSGLPSQGTLAANQTQSGQLSPLERQLWKYQGQNGEQITITVTSKSGSFDPHIGLYDASGTALTKTRPGRTGSTQTLTFTLPADATYNILIGGFGGSPGGYDIKVTSSSKQ